MKILKNHVACVKTNSFFLSFLFIFQPQNRDNLNWTRKRVAIRGGSDAASVHQMILLWLYRFHDLVLQRIKILKVTRNAIVAQVFILCNHMTFKAFFQLFSMKQYQYICHMKILVITGFTTYFCSKFQVAF